MKTIKKRIKFCHNEPTQIVAKIYSIDLIGKYNWAWIKTRDFLFMPQDLHPTSIVVSNVFKWIFASSFSSFLCSPFPSSGQFPFKKQIDRSRNFLFQLTRCRESCFSPRKGTFLSESVLWNNDTSNKSDRTDSSSFDGSRPKQREYSRGSDSHRSSN